MPAFIASRYLAEELEEEAAEQMELVFESLEWGFTRVECGSEHATELASILVLEVS